MKVAVLSESPVDEAAIRILVEGVLGRATQATPLFPLRTRGWPAVQRVLESVLKHLYFQTDAEAFVVVVDSDDSLVHSESHEQSGEASQECRLCLLREDIDRIQISIPQVPNRPKMKTAAGLAVPAIEAWFRCGVDPHITEAEWMRILQSKPDPFARIRLKREVYGTERPGMKIMVQRATEEAQRLVQDLSTQEQLFPAGFGSLARDVRNWQIPA